MATQHALLNHHDLSTVLLSCIPYTEQIQCFRGVNSWCSYTYDSYVAAEGVEYISKELGLKGSTFKPFRRRFDNQGGPGGNGGGKKKKKKNKHTDGDAENSSDDEMISPMMKAFQGRPSFGSRDESRIRLRVLPHIDREILQEMLDRVFSLVPVLPGQEPQQGQGEFPNEDFKEDEDEDEENETRPLPLMSSVRSFQELQDALEAYATATATSDDDSYLPAKFFLGKPFDVALCTFLPPPSSGSKKVSGGERGCVVVMASPSWCKKHIVLKQLCGSKVEFTLPAIGKQSFKGSTQDFHGVGAKPKKVKGGGYSNEPKVYPESITELSITVPSNVPKLHFSLSKQFMKGSHSITLVDLSGVCPGGSSSNDSFTFTAGGESDHFLANCSSLTSIKFPTVPFPREVQLGQHFLSGCISLVKLDLTPLQCITSIRDHFCTGCESLEEIAFFPREVGDTYEEGYEGNPSGRQGKDGHILPSAEHQFCYDCPKLERLPGFCMTSHTPHHYNYFRDSPKIDRADVEKFGLLSVHHPIWKQEWEKTLSPFRMEISARPPHIEKVSEVCRSWEEQPGISEVEAKAAPTSRMLSEISHWKCAPFTEAGSDPTSGPACIRRHYDKAHDATVLKPMNLPSNFEYSTIPTKLWFSLRQVDTAVLCHLLSFYGPSSGASALLTNALMRAMYASMLHYHAFWSNHLPAVGEDPTLGTYSCPSYRPNYLTNRDPLALCWTGAFSINGAMYKPGATGGVVPDKICRPPKTWNDNDVNEQYHFLREVSPIDILAELAATLDQVDVLDAMRSQGLHLDRERFGGQSELHCAVAHGWLRTTRLFLDPAWGGDPKYVDYIPQSDVSHYRYMTPLCVAAKTGRVALCRYLIQVGASLGSIEVPDLDYTPIERNRRYAWDRNSQSTITSSSSDEEADDSEGGDHKNDGDTKKKKKKKTPSSVLRTLPAVYHSSPSYRQGASTAGEDNQEVTDLLVQAAMDQGVTLPSEEEVLKIKGVLEKLKGQDVDYW